MELAEIVEIIRRDLLAYCKLDTLAMVLIYNQILMMSEQAIIGMDFSETISELTNDYLANKVLKDEKYILKQIVDEITEANYESSIVTIKALIVKAEKEKVVKTLQKYQTKRNHNRS